MRPIVRACWRARSGCFVAKKEKDPSKPAKVTLHVFQHRLPPIFSIEVESPSQRLGQPSFLWSPENPNRKRRSVCTAPIAMISESSYSNRSTARTSPAPSDARVAATPGSRPLPASATGDHKASALPGVNYLGSVSLIVAGHRADSARPEFDYAFATVFEPSDSSRWAFCV